jgi:hypothetical protein
MGIGDWVSGIFGSTNEEKAKGHDVDPNAYEYGGRPGGAQADAQRYSQRGDDWQNKASEYGAQQQGLHNRGNAGMDQAQDARGMQMDAAGMARARATGATPSIAQMQADRQMGQAAAAQTSAAASARGPGALALAQQNAAANTAGAQANISGQAQVNAAQERLAAEQAYAGQAAGIRGGDFQGAQTAYGASSQAGQLGLGAGQLGLGYTQAEMGVNQAQLQAQQNSQAQTSSNALGAQGINAGVGGQNAAMNQKNAMGAIEMGGKLVSGVAMSDARAKASPGDLVASTWGGARPNDEQAKAAEGAMNIANQKSATPIFQDPSAEDRQNAAGGGYMLGKQIGTSVYGGRPDGSLPSSVAAGMKSTGAAPKQENAKDEKKAGEAAKASKADEGQKDKLASVIGDIGKGAGARSEGVDISYHPGHGYVPPQLLSDKNAKQPVGGSIFGGGEDEDKEEKDPADVSGMMDVGKISSMMSGGGAAGISMLSDMVGKSMPSDMTGKAPTMPSDMLGKTASDERAKNPMGALGLDDPGLRIGDDGRGYIAQNAPAEQDAGQRHAAKARSGSSPGDMVASTFKTKHAGSQPRKKNDDDLMRQAMAMMGGIQNEKHAQIANGPAVRPDGSTMVSDNKAKATAWDEGYAAATGDVKKMAGMSHGDLKNAAANRPIASAFRDAQANAWDEGRTANAARALASEPYVYKPGMTPSEQAPGEINVGPMAQNMARDPVAGTAVIKQPNGMLAIDIPKYTKVLGAVAAGQQDQLDEQDAKLSRLAQMMGGR